MDGWMDAAHHRCLKSVHMITEYPNNPMIPPAPYSCFCSHYVSLLILFGFINKVFSHHRDIYIYIYLHMKSKEDSFHDEAGRQCQCFWQPWLQQGRVVNNGKQG